MKWGVGWSSPFRGEIPITASKNGCRREAISQPPDDFSRRKEARQQLANYINGKCHHEEPLSSIALDNLRKRHGSNLLKEYSSNTVTFPFKRRGKSPETINSQNIDVLSTGTYNFTMYAQRQEVILCLDYIRWHTSLFPPDRLLQVSTHASSLQLVVAQSRAVGDDAQSADVLFHFSRLEVFWQPTPVKKK